MPPPIICTRSITQELTSVPHLLRCQHFLNKLCSETEIRPWEPAPFRSSPGCWSSLVFCPCLGGFQAFFFSALGFGPSSLTLCLPRCWTCHTVLWLSPPLLNSAFLGIGPAYTVLWAAGPDPKFAILCLFPLCTQWHCLPRCSLSPPDLPSQPPPVLWPYTKIKNKHVS